ncbi:MAG: acyl-CoA dehydratase activase [Thermodesulfovibrionales bacterium]
MKQFITPSIPMRFIGLDAGSVSVKLVLLNEQGGILQYIYRRHRGQPLSTAIQLLRSVLNDFSEISNTLSDCLPFPSSEEGKGEDGPQLSLSVTGSAGRLIADILGIEPVNEVVAHAFATRRLYPHVRTVIELGGEDSKLISLNNTSTSASDFAMNSVCAAGTGSFLDQQAERLQLTIEEFSSLSIKSKNPPRIAGRCSVFAKSDMIHLQQIATPVADIVAGLCFAVARNFRGSIARGREITLPVAFLGGVAANAGMAQAFREVMGLPDLFIPEEHAVMGAIGAALKDMKATRFYPFDAGLLKRLEDFTTSSQPIEKGYSPLISSDDGFVERHMTRRETLAVNSESFHTKDYDSGPDSGHHSCTHHSPLTIRASQPLKAYLGVDIGSISTNLAVMDGDNRLLAKRYLMTAGRPIEAVKQGLAEIGKELGDSVTICGVGTTGSGRYMIADYIGADIVKNEITAQAFAAAFIDRDVDTIFEIGGQDSKYISLRDGVIIDFEMNKACAAGTGSFLEEQAEKLNVSVKEEFQQAALGAEAPCRLGERCTVFMENSLMANLQRGAAKQDLLAGLAYSIVQNYINRVVCSRPIGKKIFFQGGVAFNKSVVAAFEKYLGKKVIVPPHHDVTGAIGMALIAKQYMESRGPETGDKQQGEGKAHEVELELKTKFKGFGLAQSRYEISSFECRGCPNVCEINRVKIEGEDGYLHYGGRCEKYDIRKDRPKHKLPDLFSFREEKLWEGHLKYREKFGVKGENIAIHDSPFTIRHTRGTIGIPYIFYFHDYLPFWTTLLWELGFEVEVSPPTDRKTVDLGLENVIAETCFPVKAAFGHIRHLIGKNVDAILLPSFVDLNLPGNPLGKGYACPYTQTVPYTAGIALREATFLTPVISFHRGNSFLKKELKKIFRSYAIKQADLEKAMAVAEKAQLKFAEDIKREGSRILSGLKEKAVVIVGRAYNAFDSGMNLNIPKKLADLGVISLPMDFLPLEEQDIGREWPNMYWRAGQRILSAARIITQNPLLYSVYIGNFSCGPDSFIIKFFEEELAGKPYLHLEIDAHSADAGAITRCEAFLDSIGNNKDSGRLQGAGFKGRAERARPKRYKTGGNTLEKRTVFIPRMSDHTFAVAAAFRHCGVDAEVLPEPSRESVDLGKKYVSGKECYPCAVTTGDMAGKIMEAGFNPDKSAFFMPSGTGPCRFGQYNVFHRLVMRDLGLKNTPVFSPTQNEDFYKDLGMVGKNFTLKCWEGIIAIELLTKCLHETRPYEKESGTAKQLYQESLGRICTALTGTNGSLGITLAGIRKGFEAIPRTGEERPLIGIVGEIFVRSSRFSNEDLARQIEALGGEAYLAPVDEWLYYVNHVGRQRVKAAKDWPSVLGLSLKRYIQKRTEQRLARQFEGFLKTLHEPDTARLIKLAAPYIHESFEGEAILSIGKSIDLIHSGASGIVSAMPFGCMPGTIVSALLRGLHADFGVPCLSIPYDGTESLTTRIQIEAFMDQARSFQRDQKRV